MGKAFAVAMMIGAAGAHAQPLPPVVVDAMPSSLTGVPGDPARGRAVVVNRQLGHCLLCHALPIAEERFQGDLGPDLAGVADRLSVGQIRLRVVDATRLNPRSVMPPYHRTDGLLRVAAEYRGRPVLTAEQVEDVVAFLATLRR